MLSRGVFESQERFSSADISMLQRSYKVISSVLLGLYKLVFFYFFQVTWSSSRIRTSRGLHLSSAGTNFWVFFLDYSIIVHFMR